MSKGKGGGGGGGSINPMELAQAQTQSNIATAQNQAALNNSNVNNPLGSSTWTPYTDANGQVRYTLTQQLAPQNEITYANQKVGATDLAQLIPSFAGMGQQALSGVGNFLGSLIPSAEAAVSPTLNLSGVPTPQQVTPANFQTSVAQGPIQTSVSSDFPTLVKQAQDAAYQSQTQYLDPQYSQAKSNLDQQLADQGIQPGTAAYDRAQGDFARQKQMAYQSAQDQAVAAGNQQEQALFGQSVQAGSFANQAQQQQFSQGLSMADLLNQAELASINQGNQAAQLGLQRAVATQQAPVSTLGALTSAAGGVSNIGTSNIATGGNLVNVAPTWSTQIPTMGGYNYPVAPTNYAAATQAAGQYGLSSAQALNQNLSTATSLGNLFGLTGTGGLLTSGGGLFSSGGLLGSLFSGGGATAADAFGGSAGVASLASGFPFLPI